MIGSYGAVVVAAGHVSTDAGSGGGFRKCAQANNTSTTSALSAAKVRVAGVERSEPPVRQRWGLASLDPSHPTLSFHHDKALVV